MLRRFLVHWLVLAVALAVTAGLLDSVDVSGGVIGLSDALQVGGFFATVLAALVLSVVSTLLGWVLGPRG